mmetsp:Transcript_28763/g.84951  ORF Transcript_28763/g.84951 Transcript_28763/m.84951 type:complete len:267 (+) Transcript_28763:1071-1871(+)
MTLSWSRFGSGLASSSTGERGRQERPGKRAPRSRRSTLASGSIVSSSAKMHAKDQTSIAAVYRCSRISSGARYQRVTTCDVIWREICGGGLRSSGFSLEHRRASAGAALSRCSLRAQSLSSTTRASPKSHSLTSHRSERSTFAGLRSRCSTCAEWRYCSPTSIWWQIHCTCGTVIVCGEAISLRKSRSTKSKTTHRSEKADSDCGRSTSRILMMLGWSRWRRIRSSRRIRFASVAWQNALLIFLIATLPPPAAEWSSGSFAAQTSP